MLNNFKNEELVKVQGRMFPVVGGRLRLAHEDNANLSIETKVISYDTEVAIIHAMVKTEKGVFNGLGNASVKRDRVLSNAILLNIQALKRWKAKTKAMKRRRLQKHSLRISLHLPKVRTYLTKI